MARLRKDVEEAKIQHEATLASLKRKQVDAVEEMSEQMDTRGFQKNQHLKFNGCPI